MAAPAVTLVHIRKRRRLIAIHNGTRLTGDRSTHGVPTNENAARPII